MSRRTDRVDDLLRHELSDLMRREMSDPRVRLASISEVHVTPDLRKARISVSVFGEEAEREGCIEALNHASGYLRHHLASRLRLRVTPELQFVLDRGPEHSARIAAILEGLHVDDEQDGT